MEIGVQFPLLTGHSLTGEEVQSLHKKINNNNSKKNPQRWDYNANMNALFVAETQETNE